MWKLFFQLLAGIAVICSVGMSVNGDTEYAIYAVLIAIFDVLVVLECQLEEMKCQCKTGVSIEEI